MSDYSDMLRTTLEDVQAELVEADLPGTARVSKWIAGALALQNPNAIEVEIRKTQYGYEIRCHGANGITTIGAGSDLAVALYSLADWAKSQAEWRETEMVGSV